MYKYGVNEGKVNKKQRREKKLKRGSGVLDW